MPHQTTARGRYKLVALALVPVLFHVVIVETSGIRLALAPRFGALFKLGFVTASALTHWAIYASLLVTFAITLRRGSDPLITAMARRMHGPITAELETYTRRVTIAWCCFFAAQLAISITLFVFAPLVAWSFFVNIMDLPLVAAMFGAEYLVRMRCLSDPPRHSIGAIMAMIADIRASPRPQPARSP
jgi:uncharacterized membrane protein